FDFIVTDHVLCRGDGGGEEAQRPGFELDGIRCALARQYFPLRGDGLFRNSGAEPKEPFNLECLFRTEAHVAGVFDAPINGQNARRKRIPRRGVVGFEVLDRDSWDDVTGDTKVNAGTDLSVKRE